jgi:peptidoglycan/xylan/chitin deacetylase (PgdA/CDA1 family)
MSTLKRAMLQGLQSTLSMSGLAALYVRLRGICGATILMYHSVAREPESAWVDPRYHVDPETFEAQMSFLSRHRKVVSMPDLVEAIEGGRDLPAGSVALTFDDGYLDNLTVAAPILSKYGFPATLYLASAYVSRAENQWIDRLFGLFRSRTRQELLFEGDSSSRFDLSDPEQERTAYRTACKILLEGSLDRRIRCFEEIDRRLSPESSGPRLTLNWDEVRDLVRRFPRFEIGAHTSNHIDLPGNEGDLAEKEISGCTEEIRRELGQRPQHFSFPYNRWNPVSKDRVRRNGYRSAVGSGTDYLITRKSDPYALPRIDSGLSLRRLNFVTSGAYPGLTLSLVGQA